MTPAEPPLAADAPPPADQEPWKILVVDDEPAVHQITRLALRNLVVLGRPSLLLNALSAADAREQLQRHPDIALLLLDVVMESEHAGLDLVRYVREEQHNKLVRIILRTGQPGQAPERAVMVDYDINDYKEKTELTANKLYTTVLAGLRTYQHMASLSRLRLAVEALGRLNADIFGAAAPAELAEALAQGLWTSGAVAGVRCALAGGPVLAERGQPHAAPLDGALATAALASPGSVQREQERGALALARAAGASMTLDLSLSTPRDAQDDEVLALLVHSTAAAVARWHPAREL